MRTLRQIEQDLATEKDAYLAARAALDAAAATAHAATLKALQAEHAAVITDGATACACQPEGGTLWGLRKRPGVFEVGCLTCGERARGETPADAVAAWNAGVRVPVANAPALTVQRAEG